MRSSASVPRTEAPTATSGSERVASTSATIQRSSELVRVHVRDGVLQQHQLVEPDRGLERLERVLAPLRAEDRELVLGARVAERRPQEEAVELRLREREGALVLERVLGREHEERLGQAARHAVDGDLPLRHRLEQRRLRLRHRAVDLVDEHDVREHRPRPELELARALVVDAESPVTSVGCRSGVHCTREWTTPSIEPASARASTVLAVPGTSSKSTWPRQASAASTSRTCSVLPSTTCSTFASRRSATACARSSPATRRILPRRSPPPRTTPARGRRSRSAARRGGAGLGGGGRAHGPGRRAAAPRPPRRSLLRRGRRRARACAGRRDVEARRRALGGPRRRRARARGRATAPRRARGAPAPARAPPGRRARHGRRAAPGGRDPRLLRVREPHARAHRRDAREAAALRRAVHRRGARARRRLRPRRVPVAAPRRGHRGDGRRRGRGHGRVRPRRGPRRDAGGRARPPRGPRAGVARRRSSRRSSSSTCRRPRSSACSSWRTRPCARTGCSCSRRSTRSRRSRCGTSSPT